MGTTQSERWELNSIKVNYKGGFTGDDVYVEPKEYGPLVRVELPLSEGFESGFPTTAKPTYEKYGLTAGRDNLQWSTWYGSFSWHNPQQIAHEKYADRETIQSFTYELGKKANAKIRIEIDPDSGHPGKGQGHYDLIFDDFVFE